MMEGLDNINYTSKKAVYTKYKNVISFTNNNKMNGIYYMLIV